MTTTSTHVPRRSWARTARRPVTTLLVAAVAISACSDDDGVDLADAGARAGGAAASVGAETTLPVAPTTSVPIGTGSVAGIAPAVVIGEIGLDAELRFLRGDGTHLYATGSGGVVVRIDPRTGDVDAHEVEGLSGERVLPSVADTTIWLSDLDGTEVVGLDRTTFTKGPVLDVGSPAGLVFAGPDGATWMEVTAAPGALVRLDPATGEVGEPVALDGEGEAVGSASGFGSIWVPRFDSNEILRLDATGTLVQRVPTGVAPMFAHVGADAVWFVNQVDATLGRIDPETLDVTVTDLSTDGLLAERPTGPVTTTDAIWVMVSALDDPTAIVLRIDASSGAVVGRRSLPGGRRIDQLSGLATVGDRVFVLDRPARTLLELDPEEFLRDASADPNARTEEVVGTRQEGEAEIRALVEEVFDAGTDPDRMAELIEHGASLHEAIAGFKAFFEEHLPGEQYRGELLAVDHGDDIADIAGIDYAVTVGGSPVVEPQRGEVRHVDDRWLLTRDTFCALVGLGGIECAPVVVATDLRRH